MNDLVKQWKEAARRDDLFDHMVPSDVRQLLSEIERLRDLLRRTLDVVESDEFAGPFVISAIHGMGYAGPVIPTDEIRKALGSDSERIPEGEKT